MELPLIAAIRGRYNPDGSITQKLEVNPRGVSNTITTVGKDNMVVEMDKHIIQRPRGFNKGGIKDISPTITINAWEQNNFVLEENEIEEEKVYEGKWRIRKLTSLECFRLMAFDDEDWEKAAEVNSNSALYKQSGNSIVVSVLEGIFSQMFKDRMPQTT